MPSEIEKFEALKKYVKDENLRERYSSINYDVEADVYFFRTEDGGRHTPAAIGYRPGHYVTDEIMTTGAHYYLEQDCLFPGHQAKTKIVFLIPEHYPHCLWVGKKVMIHEGALAIGYAKITKIFNKLLEKQS
jgi:elongation factor Tu